MSKLTLEENGIEIIYEGKPINEVSIYQMVCETCDCIFEFTEDFIKSKKVGGGYITQCPCCEENVFITDDLENYLARRVVWKKEKVKI